MGAESWIAGDQTVQRAAGAEEDGQGVVSRQLLEQVVQANPRSESAWLRLANAVDTKMERRYCLAQALSINQSNALARRELRALGAGTTCSPLDTTRSRPRSKKRLHINVRQLVRDSPVPVIVGYLLAITFTEFLTLVVEPLVGLWGHGALLVVLIVHSALIWRRPFYKLVLALAFAPLIRLVSLAMPLYEFPLIYWYLLTSLPLFFAAFLVTFVVGYTRNQIAVSTGNLGVQFLIGLSGLVLGYVEYYLLRPEPLSPTLAWDQIAIPALILLVSTGFIEELIFRGIMQRAAEECLGRQLAWIYVAAIFAMMHMGHSSWLDILFVFGASIFFSWAVSRTGSLLGVTLAHGLTNILLFLILPTLAEMRWEWLL
jgi:membrane protease YdiL (CAAX protease family)